LSKNSVKKQILPILSQTTHTRIGRYTDAYKGKIQLAAWQRAIALYDKGAVMDAYLAFFEYLRDEKDQNLNFTVSHTDKNNDRNNDQNKDQNNEIRFDFYQGSKHILGSITDTHIAAYAKVVACESLNVGFMRRLLVRNAHLLYTNFTLDEQDNICIRFSSAVTDCSPQKLYFSLKELALSADKEDDLLLTEFPMLRTVDSTHTVPLNATQTEQYFYFFSKWLNSTQTLTQTLDGKRNSGIIAFILLNLVYKIDALLQPEGAIMETCDRIHQHYFENNSTNAADKLPAMLRELQALLGFSADDLQREIYTTTTTFGITRAANTTQIRDFIAEQLPNIQHYQQAQQPLIANAIIGFAIGSCFFNYAVPKPQRAVFDLWYRVSESEFFETNLLNIKHKKLVNPTTKAIDKAAVLDKINAITTKHAAEFPDFSVDITLLNFETVTDFGVSLLGAMV
jgi:hypothetical protein